MKYLISIFCCILVCTTNVSADDFSKEHLQLRLEIVKFLAKEGYKPEKPDADGDIWFKKDSINYCVIINKNWISPYQVSLYTQYSYDETDTREAVRNCMSFIAQKYKTVKLYASTNRYNFRSDIFCEDVSLFTLTLPSLIQEMHDAIIDFHRTTRSDLADIDLSDYDAVFLKARTLYLLDEDREAFFLFNMLAEAEFSDAYSYVAECYRYGYGVSKDIDKMISYYQKGIDAGEMKCAYYLANYLYDNEDYTNAYNNYLKCGTNEGTYKSLALYKLGYMQETGRGTEQNLTQAITSYKRSVKYSRILECDARKALIRLNEPVENKADFVSANKTMLLGLSTSEMYDRGREYEYGLQNRLVSLPKAFAYYKAAADAGYTKAYSKMGEIYISQYYPFQDKKKSDKYYMKVFKLLKPKEATDGEACYELGRMFEYGYGVDKDLDQAQYYYKSGAMMSDKNACWRFGVMCKEDLDYAEAFKYFKIAAEKGQSSAMYELAQCYENGTGTPTNKKQAIEWYTKCSRTFSEASSDAQKALERLASTGSKQQ